MTFARLKKTIRALYEGATPRGVGFRYALLAFEIITVALILADFAARCSSVSATRSPQRHPGFFWLPHCAPALQAAARMWAKGVTPRPPA